MSPATSGEFHKRAAAVRVGPGERNGALGRLMGSELVWATPIGKNTLVPKTQAPLRRKS